MTESAANSFWFDGIRIDLIWFVMIRSDSFITFYSNYSSFFHGITNYFMLAIIVCSHSVGLENIPRNWLSKLFNFAQTHQSQRPIRLIDRSFVRSTSETTNQSTVPPTDRSFWIKALCWYLSSFDTNKYSENKFHSEIN